jgi:hypothetical protein
MADTLAMPKKGAMAKKVGDKRLGARAKPKTRAVKPLKLLK